MFPQVLCLTLAGQRERQLAAARELEKAGIRNYEFFPGFEPGSAEVRRAFQSQRVKRYPDCFRCGRRDCGNAECNNVLLPAQVAVALGFQAILEAVAGAAGPYAAICEDDVVFAGYAAGVLASGRFRELLRASGLGGEAPALLRLSRPGIDPRLPTAESAPDVPLELTDEIVMSNYLFVVNRGFARLAAARLARIDHTADTLIHEALQREARCHTLSVPLAGDRSWSLGEIPSLIHPKTHHLLYLRQRFGESSPEARGEAERLRHHRKKALSRPYCLTGSPRCGSHYVSAFLRANGLDVGHESLGRDGICAWQFAVSSDDYPYITDPLARTDFFVHGERWLLYARHPLAALPSLIVENQKAPLSYAFRRAAIRAAAGVNLDDFPAPLERAARAYAHWYLLALQRRPQAVLRVEQLREDCGRAFEGRRFQDVQMPAHERGAGKPYLGFAHPPQPLPPDWSAHLSPETLGMLRGVASTLGYEI